MHVHSSPDPDGQLRLDALDTGRFAHEAEMSGFVLKSHFYQTLPIAETLSKVYPGLQVLGSIVLNNQHGGLNPYAVEIASKLGARVIWMPTINAHHYMAKLDNDNGIRVLDHKGDLVPQIHEILDIVKHADMVLASGHLSPDETLSLFKAANRKGIHRILATHPLGIASIDQMQEMVELGACIEFTLHSSMPYGHSPINFGATSLAEIVFTIRELGIENCLMSSDFGQWINPPPAEGMRMAIASLLHSGMSSNDVSSLVKQNPIRLVSQS